MIGLVWSWFRI